MDVSQLLQSRIAVERIEDILLAEGEMVFEAAAPGEIHGQLAFRSDEPNKTDPILILAGSSEAGAPATAKFRGIGLTGTAAEGWVYDYVAYLVPHWPGGKDQKGALVGTVTRLVDHKGSGGAVRHHRLHHFVWHTLRNYWTNDDAITPAMKTEIIKLGWEVLRPVLTPTRDPIFDNGSGEDFLYMHRQMVIEVNELLNRVGKPRIEPWATIPGPEPLVVEPDYTDQTPRFTKPGNPHGFSVPPAWVSDDVGLAQRLSALKTADFYWSRMLWWDRQYKDPAYLSTLTLGELGTLLEWTVHNDMHMRWASVPRDPRTGAIILNGRDGGDINKAWDDPEYDNLGDQYSSHVNPVFWRLHGWVDARIEDWFSAHETAHPGEVKKTDVMGTPWFVGKWVQVDMPWPGPMHHMHAIGVAAERGHDHDDDVKIMERIIALIFGPPTEATPSTVATFAAPIRYARPHRGLTSSF